MNERDGLIRNYAPILGLVALMIFIFFYATLPSLKMNRYLSRVRAQRIQEIHAIQKTEEQYQHLNEALEEDPMTIENQLRSRFGGAKGEGEEEVSGPPR